MQGKCLNLLCPFLVSQSPKFDPLAAHASKYRWGSPNRLKTKSRRKKESLLLVYLSFRLPFHFVTLRKEIVHGHDCGCECGMNVVMTMVMNVV